MTTIQAQLPLVFETRNAYSFSTLVSGDNELAVGIARQCAEADASGPNELQVLVWASPGSGKSHLLQACCQQASSLDKTVCYLPASELRKYEPSVLEDMERLDLLVIDDVDALLPGKAWEEGLFDLINRCRESRTALLLSTAAAPEHLEMGLPDLRSRLQWGPVFQLQPLSDELKAVALQLRANHKGLELEKKVAEYLVNRYSRDMSALFERLDQLDRASLAAQRKLTIPFVKSIFE